MCERRARRSFAPQAIVFCFCFEMPWEDGPWSRVWFSEVDCMFEFVSVWSLAKKVLATGAAELFISVGERRWHKPDDSRFLTDIDSRGLTPHPPTPFSKAKSSSMFFVYKGFWMFAAGEQAIEFDDFSCSRGPLSTPPVQILRSQSTAEGVRGRGNLPRLMTPQGGRRIYW